MPKFTKVNSSSGSKFQAGKAALLDDVWTYWGERKRCTGKQA
jgi:hypothetical protein